MVVAVGVTLRLLSPVTDPTPPLIDRLLAPVTDQESVADWPAVTLAGEAPKAVMTAGADGGGVAADSPPPPQPHRTRSSPRAMAAGRGRNIASAMKVRMEHEFMRFINDNPFERRRRCPLSLPVTRDP